MVQVTDRLRRNAFQFISKGKKDLPLGVRKIRKGEKTYENEPD